MPLSTGLAGSAELKVTDADTALTLHSGDVPVLGTPRLVALAEEATIAAVGDSLGPGETTVGMRVQIDHLSPSPVGCMVSADASLERVEGRRLVFSVSVRDERGLVAAGKITRVVVDRLRFLEKCR